MGHDKTASNCTKKIIHSDANKTGQAERGSEKIRRALRRHCNDPLVLSSFMETIKHQDTERLSERLAAGPATCYYSPLLHLKFTPFTSRCRLLTVPRLHAEQNSRKNKRKLNSLADCGVFVLVVCSKGERSEREKGVRCESLFHLKKKWFFHLRPPVPLLRTLLKPRHTSIFRH